VNFSGISSKSFLGRLIRLPLRLIPAGMVVPILQGPLRGQRWITGSGTHGCWLGSYEYKKQRVFADAINPGMIVYDVGAHVGFYTMLASCRVGSSGKVIAFEPLPRNINLLKRHLALNGCGNVSVAEWAVSDRPGLAWFTANPERSFEGHLSAGGDFQVQAVTLDDLWSGGKLPIPDVIKIDVEGAEHDALLGARQLLKARHPLIFLATHSVEKHSQCCRLLLNLGYELHSIDERPIDNSDEIVAEYQGK